MVGMSDVVPVNSASLKEVVPAVSRIGANTCGGGSGITSEDWNGTFPKVRTPPTRDNPLEGYLGKDGRRFSKPGRPRGNVVERRLDIYERVAPLLAERGMSRLSMEQAARTAHVSVGTLYRYFPNKRSLVLYGINPEPADLLCARFAQSAQLDRRAIRAALADFIVQNVQLMRPSVDAAIRLGPEVVRTQLDQVARQPLDTFAELLALGMPLNDRRTPEHIERVVRRTIVSSLMEKEFESEQLRDTFEDLLAGGYGESGDARPCLGGRDETG